jgi:purine nucleosidase
VDFHRRTARTPNTDVAIGLDVDAFWRLLMAAVRKVGAASGPSIPE